MPGVAHMSKSAVRFLRRATSTTGVRLKGADYRIPAQDSCYAVINETFNFPGCHGNSMLRLDITDQDDKQVRVRVRIGVGYGLELGM